MIVGNVGEITLRYVVLVGGESVLVAAAAVSGHEGGLLGGEARIFVFVRTDGGSLLAVALPRRHVRMMFCALPTSSRVVAVAPSVEMLYENVAVVLMQLVGHDCLIGVDVRRAHALQMFLIQVEVHALVVDLLL